MAGSPDRSWSGVQHFPGTRLPGRPTLDLSKSSGWDTGDHASLPQLGTTQRGRREDLGCFLPHLDNRTSGPPCFAPRTPPCELEKAPPLAEEETVGPSRCFYPRKQLQAAIHHPLLPPADVDKCQRKPRLCKGRSICINTQGNYTCRCPPGLELNLSDPNVCSGRGPGRRCEAAPELGRGQGGPRSPQSREKSLGFLKH